jgi:hypothetical protein
MIYLEWRGLIGSEAEDEALPRLLLDSQRQGHCCSHPEAG